MGQAPASSIQQAWRDHAQPFTAVVTQTQDWDAPSPCEGWAARDVLAHVIDTQRDFLRDHGHPLPGDPAATSGQDSSGGAAADPGASEQGASAPGATTDPAEQWLAHASEVDALLADSSIADESFDGFFGPTTIGETLSRFYGFDLLVHRWDIGTSQGAQVRFSDDELAAIDTAVDGFGEHAYMPGIFNAPVDPGPGASRQEQVLGRTGRHPVA